MTNDSSYKVSFILAVTIHALLVVLLLIKFTTSHKANSTFGRINSVINATAVSESNFNRQMSKPLVHQQQTPPKPEKVQEPVVKQQQAIVKKEQLQNLLQKNLLIEQARELAELKSERQKYKTSLAKQKQKQQQQMQKMLQEQVAAEQKELIGDEKALEAKAAAGGGGQLGEEVDKIRQAISSQWNVPDGAVGGDFCQLLIQLAPGGVVLNTKILRSSGNLALERSAEAAVLKASPLPVPEDAGLFDRVRNIKLMFKPEGVI